jgi:glycosyltransferase involved in cell wall biosynthesis
MSASMTSALAAPASTMASADYRVLVLAPNPWQGQWVNRQQLFSRLGSFRAVLYSSGGWLSWQCRSLEWRQAAWRGRTVGADNVEVDEPARWLVRVPRVPTLDRLALRLQSQRWRARLAQRGSGPLIAYVYHPMFVDYLDFLGADRIVYHAYDFYEHTPGWDEHLELKEQQLLKRADKVIGSSPAIAEGLAAKGGRPVQVLPNGADSQAITAAVTAGAPLPTDLEAIPRPRLGWVGSVHPEIDLALVADVATARPDWHFVLVGSTPDLKVPRAEAERARCRALPNVHFLGGRLVSDVPAYIAGMDVNLMCYRIADGTWIKSIYPLKLHEYLASGRPVVSSDVPAVREFDHVVRIASGTHEWMSAIEDALAGRGAGSAEQRIAVAAANTWDQRVETLDRWLSTLVAAPTGDGARS